MNRLLRNSLLGMAACAASFASAPVATAGDGEFVPLDLEFVTSGMTRPLYVTHAPGDFDRIFIVEQPGRIRVYNFQTSQLSVFMDITGPVRSSGNEQGLLGLAFHPNYDQNGFFYVNYTADNGSGDTRVSRFSVNPGNPNLGDAGSEVVLLQFNQPFTNHNGGWIGFSPTDDGNYLYVASGDGGSGNDPQGNGQKVSTPLGKILRIDVDASSAGNAAPAPGNPFEFTSGDPLIWHWGMRNPWRCSFDAETGDFIMGDVGQFAREEISVQAANPAGAGPGDAGYQGGQNYGWRCMEGFGCTGLSGCTCNSTSLTMPAYQYTHSGGKCSITGGIVYRGCRMPELSGRYFFGDYCTGEVFSMVIDVENNTQSNFINYTSLIGLPNFNLVTFGTDAFGEMYTTYHSSGSVWRIVPDGSYVEDDCDGDGIADACAIAAGSVADNNNDGIPDSCQAACDGDLDGDNDIDSDDLGQLLGAFGQNNSGDVDGDGDTDSDDLGILLGAFGQPC